jgi:hypothetical protein
MAAHTLARRAEARELIRPELALSRSDLPLSIARTFHRAWFDAIDDHVRHGRIVIFERAVVGQPTPLLWEVTHLARLGVSPVITDLADQLGDEEDDEDGERVPEFVIEMLNTDADRARCVDWIDIYRELIARFDDHRVDDMAFYLEIQLALAAEHIRVGQGAVAAVWPNVRRAPAA